MNFTSHFKWILTLVISCGLFASSALDASLDSDRFTMKLSESQVQPNIRVVKAVLIDGASFPMIELPVVEITGKISRKYLVRAELIEGRIVPSILLDEITVTPSL